MFLLFGVVEEEPVDVFRISIRHKKPIWCAVRDANVPHSRPVSRASVSYVPYFNHRTCHVYNRIE